MRSGVVLVAIALGSAAPARAERPIEGAITVASTGTDGSVTARFARSSVWGAALGTDGPCTLYPPGHAEGLTAGSISITGTAQPITLEESRGKYSSIARQGPVAFAPGATISAMASGGADVPAFTAVATAPAALTGYAAPTFISRSGYTATWTPSAGTEIWIMIGAFNTRVKGGAMLLCRVADTGRFTVPASAFELIPAPYDRAVVMISRVAETVQDVGDARVALDVIYPIAAEPIPLFGVAPPRPAVHCETSPRKFLSIAVGIGGLSRNGDAPPTQGLSYRLALGQRLRHNLHIVEEVSWSDAGYISPYTTYTGEPHWSYGAGVRWMPLEPAPQRSQAFAFPGPFIDLRAWYVTAIVGADLRERVNQLSSAEEDTWSPMTSLAVGLLEIQGHDWSLGPGFREQLAYYDGNLQRGWMLLVAAHLNEW